MNLEEYQTLFMAASLVLILVCAIPTFTIIISIPKTQKPFSELWILGPNRALEDYPFNISIGEQKLVFVGVGNHMGFSTYYMVYVKFRNQTQPLPDTENSTPSPLPPLYEFRFFLADGEKWETSLNFTILGASIRGDSLFVERISINDVVFEVEYAARRDLGLFYQMFFELWLYDMTMGEFQYYGFVSIWLKFVG